MSVVTAKAVGAVGAPAETVYGYLADVAHHSRFLPPAFSGFEVEEGGVGAGTVVHFIVAAGGRSRRYRMRVAEPEPGRVLTESDMGSSLVTTFAVTPAAASDGPACRVQIHTTWNGAGGVGGFFERLFAPRAMRRIYDDELRRLDVYARQQAGGQAEQ